MKVTTLKEAQQLLKTHQKFLKKKFGIKEIGIFGSFARQEQTPVSDIDILVEFEPSYKTFDNYMDLKFYLEEILGLKVDLVTKKALKKRIQPYIEADLIHVF
ncbi:nucleotidyltransferase family protein [Thermodesulfatator atlanticus]|uniref:nucleotidyltransferase family protein n=1 Tax=Thermodesulfatator atlanticus TaxID=501497 RepID=UPI0003B729BC|nr:nucleotidyltransferase family protein [Thermodesulfatator atlanticus]